MNDSPDLFENDAHAAPSGPASPAASTPPVPEQRGLWAWWSRRRARSKAERDALKIDSLPTDAGVQSAMASVMLRDWIKERRRDRQWINIKRAGIALFFLVGLVYYTLFQAQINGLRLMPRNDVVGIVRISGNIMNDSGASADAVIPRLKRAFETENVKAVILAIDSPGGAPLEAERINFMIDHLRKEHPKPVYSVIQNVGASAGYMIAMRGDKIFAGRYSLVGSVGAVMSVWNVHKAADKLNIEQKVYASGPLKAMLSPFLPVTPEAERKAQSIVDLAGKNFMEEVRAKRSTHLETGVKYDTGEIWNGQQAKEIGLVDEIVTIESVAALVPDAKTYDFGPGAPGRGMFGAAIGSITTAVLNSLQQHLTDRTSGGFQ